MTNTYPDDAPDNIKLLEEVRCLRCVNERILRALDEGLFVDYQMEKFTGSSEERCTIHGPEETGKSRVTIPDYRTSDGTNLDQTRPTTI